MARGKNSSAPASAPPASYGATEGLSKTQSYDEETVPSTPGAGSSSKTSRRPMLYTLAIVLVTVIGAGLLVATKTDLLMSVAPKSSSSSKFNAVAMDLHKSKDEKSDKDDKKVDGINFHETFNPTPENRKGKRGLKRNGVNFVETFNPTPENKKRGLKKTDGINFVETFNPTPENKKRGLKKTDGINFVETFNPTPENKKRRLKKSKVDTINYEETFNPTPVKLHPTQRPVHESKQRSLKTTSEEHQRLLKTLSRSEIRELTADEKATRAATLLNELKKIMA